MIVQQRVPHYRIIINLIITIINNEQRGDVATAQSAKPESAQLPYRQTCSHGIKLLGISEAATAAAGKIRASEMVKMQRCAAILPDGSRAKFNNINSISAWISPRNSNLDSKLLTSVSINSNSHFKQNISTARSYVTNCSTNGKKKLRVVY